MIRINFIFNYYFIFIFNFLFVRAILIIGFKVLREKEKVINIEKLFLVEIEEPRLEHLKIPKG
jgi:hypothetical protein